MSLKSVIDISRRITADALVYPGDPPLEMKSLCEIDETSPCKVTKLGWSTHFLTHIDFPSHFFKNGATLENIPLDRFISDATVIEVAGDIVMENHIPSESECRGKSLLFKTRNSNTANKIDFDGNHVYMSPQAAGLARDRGVNLVGIDYISIDRCGDESYPVHYILLGADIPILEGLDLSNAPPGNYTLSALPLKIADGDGSPVRAVLICDTVAQFDKAVS
ncbi:MAG TPA: cyclase family protein [Oculatellaceae cyanobacterium]